MFRVWLSASLLLVGSGRNASLMRVWLLTLLLLVTLGVESWPDACLALDFALARDSWLGILA